MTTHRRAATPASRVRSFVRILVTLVFLFSVPLVLIVEAQETAEDPVPAAAAAVQSHAPHDATVPAGAVRGFIDACRGGDYETAARRLNLAGITDSDRAAEGPRLARRFKVVLDRKLWIHYEMLSDSPEGNLDDGLPADLEQVEAEEGGIEVFLERVEDDGQLVWKFAASTVARIPDFYAEFGYGPLLDVLPAPMFEIHFLEMKLWQWVGLIVLLIAAWLGSWVLARLLHLVVRPLVSRTRSDIDDQLLELMIPPARLILALLLFVVGTIPLLLSVRAYEILAGVEKAVAVLAITWVALRAVDVIAALVGERLERAGRKSAVAVLPLGRRSMQVFLALLAVIGVLQNLGLNVTGLIAGLGVGGLALALAAQKSLENLFGGVMLIADQPVRVGDFCKFGDKTGTVEEIGLRSTRIRTPERTRISIPNSVFSEIQLENFALRDRIRLLVTLGLRYETTPDQLRYVLAELRKVLLAHPKVITDGARVRFAGFGASSLDVEVLCYIRTTDFAEYVAIREDMYLQFMDVVSEGGSGFAFPSQTLYMGKDEPLDETLARNAEEQVRRWRASGDLPFPDVAAATLDEMDGTGEWPPRGSVLAPAPGSERLPSDDTED